MATKISRIAKTNQPAQPTPGSALVAPVSAELSTEEILRRRIAELDAQLTQAQLRAAEPAAPARPARRKGAADYRREVDLAIIAHAGKLVTEMVPVQFQTEVAKLIANQLHHLSTPALGWPSENLPTPDRSDWR